MSELSSTPPSTSGRSSVQSVTRAFEILEALAFAGRAIGITDIAQAVDLPLATVHRILSTLVDTKYVFQTSHHQYAIGARLISLCRYAGGALGVALRPYLTQVVEATGESASIAMLDQDFARYISHVPSEHSMRMFTEVGNQVSLHSTAVGKAILSAMPTHEVRAILARSELRRFTPNTIVDAGEFFRELERIRATGFALDREEHEVGVRCMAVPIPSPLHLAMSVSGPPSRLTDEAIAKALPVLRAACEETSTALALDSAYENG